MLSKRESLICIYLYLVACCFHLPTFCCADRVSFSKTPISLSLQDKVHDFEKKRNTIRKYDREAMLKTIRAMKRISEIKRNREAVRIPWLFLARHSHNHRTSLDIHQEPPQDGHKIGTEGGPQRAPKVQGGKEVYSGDKGAGEGDDQGSTTQGHCNGHLGRIFVSICKHTSNAKREKHNETSGSHKLQRGFSSSPSNVTYVTLRHHLGTLTSGR